MNILILNRRDIANPSMGGAEIYTHEIARGLTVAYQCSVTVFSSRYKGAKDCETIDKVRYIRHGNEVSVHIWGFIYALRYQNEFDVVIDEFNGVGFFTFFLPKSCILIHQLYREFWFKALGIAGFFPYVIEGIILRFYRKRPAVTISNSTKADLERLGFRDVSIVMAGIKCDHQYISVEKDRNPVLVYLGRLRNTKRPKDAIRIFKRMKTGFPYMQLWIIGSGPEDKKLKKISAKINNITFLGRVDDRKKFELLRKASILLVPSVREGFGINVVEAASVGTPAVGYRVAGLRDAIIHGETGFLAKDISEATGHVNALLCDPSLYAAMSARCMAYANTFTWDRQVEAFWNKICMRNA